MKTLRIFISSPGDVHDERERARQVVQGLRKRYVQYFDLKPILWEELPLQLDASFQQGIDLVLSEEHGIDIAVFILWSRLGSPVGSLIQREDGSEYRSGTERELDVVLRARRASGGERPRILAYTRDDEASFEEGLRGKSTAEKDDMLRQKKLVEAFIREEFHDPERGTNLRAYHSFQRPQTFSERLRIHLQELLDGMCAGLRPDPVWNIESQGPPFRGLEAFHFEHADVFFGREDEVLECRKLLSDAARRGCAFLLLTGASGSGKSSLARAGLMPDVLEHEIDDTVAAWLHTEFTPSALGDHPVQGMANVLLAAVPALRSAVPTPEDLPEALMRDPQLAVRLLLVPALKAESVKLSCKGAVRLILLADQLEELFTDPRFDDEARQHFCGILDALARSGFVWVVGTLRGDFYPRLQELEPLVRLKADGKQIDLLPPRIDDIRRVIESPAMLAGLRYEATGDKTLADRILADVSAQTELLPLLEDLLRELFERRTADGLLTIAAYESLGGIEGSLSQRADAALVNLPTSTRAMLPIVFYELISMDTVGGHPFRRRGDLAFLNSEQSTKQLVDALIASRILTSDGSGIYAAHEALFRVWPKAVQWACENRELISKRSWLNDSAQRWVAENREPSLLLDTSKLIDRAETQWVYSPSLTEVEREYIQKSVTHFKRKGVFGWMVLSIMDISVILAIGLVVATKTSSVFYNWLLSGIGSDASEIYNASIITYLSFSSLIMLLSWATWRKAVPKPTPVVYRTDTIISGIGLCLLLISSAPGLFGDAYETTLISGAVEGVFWIIPFFHGLRVCWIIRRWNRIRTPINHLNFLRLYLKPATSAFVSFIFVCYIGFVVYVTIESQNSQTAQHNIKLLLNGNYNASLMLSLINDGANVNSQDPTGRSPIHQAAINNDLATIKRLLEKHHADIEAKDNSGYTPLMLAACYGDIAIVNYLIEHGADKTIKDTDGEDALYKATNRGRTDIVRLLKKNRLQE